MFVRSFCVIYLICFYGSKALSIEERLVKVDQTLEHQEVTLKHQEKTIQDQETIIKNHEKENQDLKLRLEMLENERDKVKECYTTDDLDQKDMKTADDNQSTLSHLNGMIKQQSGGIAFHAYMTGSKCVQEQRAGCV
ncbi:uncharacterized protein LOC132756097 [Ruditapes philippinarum]|uniref:uncharacterized protein LOC132756097 n=1 Tax=Ruditapes philippinarum TaxID=129788 RepID=UPI00295B0FB2|nr:uncharacterized protein LOC132756097 [Ruditapes philippinarum]